MPICYTYQGKKYTKSELFDFLVNGGEYEKLNKQRVIFHPEVSRYASGVRDAVNKVEERFEAIKSRIRSRFNNELEKDSDLKTLYDVVNSMTIREVDRLTEQELNDIKEDNSIQGDIKKVRKKLLDLLRDKRKQELFTDKAEEIEKANASNVAVNVSEKSSLKRVMASLFGLSSSKSTAVAEVFDRVLNNVAQRQGVDKKEIYKSLGFQASLIEQLSDGEIQILQNYLTDRDYGQAMNTLYQTVTANHLYSVDKTAHQLQTLMEAVKMQKEGANINDIWFKTGWEYDASIKKWITDLDGDFKLKTNTIKEGVYKLSEIVDFPSLFKYFPELENMRFEINKTGNSEYDKETKTLKFSLQDFEEMGIYEDVLGPWVSKLNQNGMSKSIFFKGILSHEIQHYIQHATGQAVGGNVGWFTTLANFLEGKQEITHPEDLELINQLIFELERTETDLFKTDPKRLYSALQGERRARMVEIRNLLGKNYKQLFPPSHSASLLQDAVEGVRLQIFSDLETQEKFRENLNDKEVPEMYGIEDVTPLLFQQDANATRGAMQVTSVGNRIIHALTDPNITTPLHELAHIYEEFLTEEEITILEDWSAHKKGTRDFSEAFAKGFEKFLFNNESTQETQSIFTKISNWFKEVIDNVAEYFGSINNLTPEVISIYNEMVNVKEAVEEKPENVRDSEEYQNARDTRDSVKLTKDKTYTSKHDDHVYTVTKDGRAWFVESNHKRLPSSSFKTLLAAREYIAEIENLKLQESLEKPSKSTKKQSKPRKSKFTQDSVSDSLREFLENSEIEITEENLQGMIEDEIVAAIETEKGTLYSFANETDPQYKAYRGGVKEASAALERDASDANDGESDAWQALIAEQKRRKAEIENDPIQEETGEEPVIEDKSPIDYILSEQEEAVVSAVLEEGDPVLYSGREHTYIGSTKYGLILYDMQREKRIQGVQPSEIQPLGQVSLQGKKKSPFDNVVEFVQTLLPGVEIEVVPAETAPHGAPAWFESIEKDGKQTSKILISSALQDDLTLPLHEMLHPFVLAVKSQNPQLYGSLMKEIFSEKTEEYNKHKESILSAEDIYSYMRNEDGSLNEDLMNDEVLVRILTEELSDYFNEEGEIKQEKLREYENNPDNAIVKFFKKLHKIIKELIFGSKADTYEETANMYSISYNKSSKKIKLISATSSNINNEFSVSIDTTKPLWQKSLSKQIQEFFSKTTKKRKGVNLLTEEADYIAHTIATELESKMKYGSFVSSDTKTGYVRKPDGAIFKLEGEEKTNPITNVTTVRGRNTTNGDLESVDVSDVIYVKPQEEDGKTIRVSMPVLPYAASLQLDLTMLSPDFKIADMAYLIGAQKVKAIKKSAYEEHAKNQTLFASIAEESSIKNFKRLRSAMDNLRSFASSRRLHEDSDVVKAARAMSKRLEILINDKSLESDKLVALHEMMEIGFSNLALAKDKLEGVRKNLNLPDLDVFYEEFEKRLIDEGFTVLRDSEMKAIFKYNNKTGVITLNPRGYSLLTQGGLKVIKNKAIFNKVENIRKASVKEGQKYKVFSQLDLLALSEDLASAKQMYATFSQFNGVMLETYREDLEAYYDNEAEDFQNYEDDRGRYIETYEKALADQSQFNYVSRRLATEFLLPTFQRLQEEAMSNLSEATIKKYKIDEKDFENLLDSADSDTYWLDMMFESTVNSKDPVNASLAVMLSETMYRNKQTLNEKAIQLKSLMKNYFANISGISETDKKGIEKYIKDNFLRQIEVRVPLRVRGYLQYEEDGVTPKTVLEKKWAFWTEYDEHKVAYEMEEWLKKNPYPDYRLSDRDNWGIIQEEYEAQKESKRLALIEKYKNPEFEKLQKDELFKTIYDYYLLANVQYGGERLKYGIIPQKRREGSTVEKLKKRYERTKQRANAYVEAAKVVEKSKVDNLLTYLPFKAITSALFRIEEEIKGHQENPDGTIYRPIVSRYLGNVEEENLDFLLTDTIIGFTEDAQNFGALKRIQHNVENLRDVINGNTRLGIEARQANLNTWSRLGGLRNKSRNTNLNKQFNSFVDDVLYGIDRQGGRFSIYNSSKSKEMRKLALQMETDLQEPDGSLSDESKKEILRKTGFYRDPQDDRKLTSDVYFPIGIDLNKASNKISYWTSVISLAGNITSGMRNSQIGNFMNLSEAYGGRYYDVKDWLKANAIYAKQMPQNFLDYTTNTKSKLNQLIMQFSAIQGEFRDKYDKMITTGTEISNLFNSDALFLVQHATEHQIQGTAMIAMMLKEKVKFKGSDKEVSLWDAYEMRDGIVQLKSGVFFPAVLQDSFIRRLQEMNRQNHGNYSAIHKGVAQRNWLGHMMLVFKKHLFTTIKARWQPARIDYSRGELVEGYHRVFFRKIRDEFNEGAWQNLFSTNKKDKGWEDYEIYGFRRSLLEMTLGVMIPMLVVALMLGFDDDDRDESISFYLSDQESASDKARQHILGLANALYTDVGITSPFGIVNPAAGWSSEIAKEIANLSTNPSAVTYTYTKIVDFLGQLIEDPYATYDKNYLDYYKKGDSKLWLKGKKLIPIYRTFESFAHPEKHLKYQTMLRSTLLQKKEREKKKKKRG